MGRDCHDLRYASGICQMSTRPNTQLRPKRSHFNVNEELSEIQEDRIVLIYVAASGTHKKKQKETDTRLF